ncbi:hypothetical protein BASA50_007137 [Batrachochytrium salamandrivorans]|uniref:Uncharacterized protein n=1 Tax=Batrachochytrium salamandrivorans TaxID=1357716 RepID=A0ABQ8F8E8_9FUNG|nr:hypothetical protein BASA50_007137 [Batrachochytrium salamandrivorans]
MKLISFAVVSLLAITVSAQSPPMPSTSKDTQDTHDTHDTQEPMDLSTHGRHQYQGAATQNTQQSQSAQELMDDSSQDSHQSQGTAVQNIPQSQSPQEPMDDSSQGRQQPQGAATQDIPQPMDAAARDIQKLQSASARILHRYMGVSSQFLQQSRSAQQADQDRVNVEIARLEGNYKKEHDIFSKIDTEIKNGELKSIKIKEMMDLIVVKLQGANLDGNEESRLTRLYDDSKIVSDRFNRGYKEQQHRHETARKKLNDAEAELQILKGNQALLAKHNADQWTHMSILPNSFYNMAILQRQYSDILKEIDVALEEQKNINTAESTHGNVLGARKEAIGNKIRILQSYSEVAGRILFKHKYNL